jgi:hypothetical protein
MLPAKNVTLATVLPPVRLPFGSLQGAMSARSPSWKTEA